MNCPPGSFGFGAIYPVSVLDAHGLRANDWRGLVEPFRGRNSGQYCQENDIWRCRAASGRPSVINVEAVITWNTKDFMRRTRLTVLTPTAFLRQH